MTIGELREALREIVKQYFSGAAVKWTNENDLKPTGPLVTLRLGNVHRELFAIHENREGHPVKLYHSRAMLEVNLYTPGGTGKLKPGIRTKAVNTALNDMQDFLNYMDSDAVSGKLGRFDITVLPEGPAQDVSALVDGLQYEYRAMQEFTVDFTQNAAGLAGIIHIPVKSGTGTAPDNPDTPDVPDNPPPDEPLPDPSAWEQTASGGGSQELAAIDTGWFEAVDSKEL